MLSLFKSNNPGVVVFYLLYLALFRIFFLFSSYDPGSFENHSEPLSKFVFKLLLLAEENYRSVSLVAGALLCFVQALLINALVNDNRILSKKNYLAGALFIVLASFFKETLFVTPVSLSLTFVILAAYRLFAVLKKEKPYGEIFDAGFCIAMATLFYFPCVLLLIFIFVGLSTLRPFQYREWIIVLLGFATPPFLAFTYYFWTNDIPLFISSIINLTGSGWLSGKIPAPNEWIVVGGITLVTLACIILLPSVVYSSVIQVRKFSTTLVILIFLTAASFLLQPYIVYSHLVLLSFPVAVLLAMVLMQLKEKVVSEVIHIILILLVLAAQFSPLLGF